MIPKVSVIMAVYNGQEYLEEAIQSLLDQTLKDIEIIIINDGSSDNTLKIIKSFSDQRIKVFDQSNMGLAKSLNKGVALANSDLIARMDADDISYDYRLQRQYEVLKLDPSICLIGGNIEYIDKSGNSLGKSLSPSSDWAIRKKLASNNCIYHPTVMFRKSAFNEAGGYDERILKYFEDYILWLKLLQNGKIYVLPDVVLKYRVHEESISSAIPTEVKEIINDFAKKGVLTDEILARFNEVVELGEFTFDKGYKRSIGYRVPNSIRRLIISLRNMVGK